MNNNQQPNYVLKFNETDSRKVKDRNYYIKKAVVIIIAIIVIITFFLFTFFSLVSFGSFQKSFINNSPIFSYLCYTSF